MTKSFLYSFGLLCVSLSVGAKPVTPAEAVRAIVGEAAGQPYAVKLGVACAIRHRGTLHGVYGLNAAHNATEPARVWNDARRAWRESATTDAVAGADHFGNASDVAKGTFIGMTLVATLGTGKDTTYFFKA